MAQKPYKVIGNLMGVPVGAIIEADEKKVVDQGLLGTLFEEAPEGSTLTDLSGEAASGPETAADDASDGAKGGNGGADPKTSPAAGSGTEPAKPALPPKPPVPPKPAVPVKEPVKTEEKKPEEAGNPAGAKPVVTPEEKK